MFRLSHQRFQRTTRTEHNINSLRLGNDFPKNLTALKTNKPIKKDFDAVQMMRDIRDKISLEIKDMTYEELRAYIDAKLAQKTRLVGQ